MSEALISIVTPCYKAEKYLRQTFACIKKQTHHNWEWLVTDDQSPDSSWDLLQQIASEDSRVRIFRNEINSGASFSRNSGLDNARGDYIAFLDADDEWLENKLSYQLLFMQKNSAKISCHNYVMMTENGTDIKPVRTVFSTVSREELRAFNPLATSFMMIEKSIIGNSRFDLTLRRRQDWVFWFEVLGDAGKAYMIPEILGRYRKDSQHSISKNKFKMAQLQWQIYRQYFKLSLVESASSFLKYAKYGISKHYLK